MAGNQCVNLKSEMDLFLKATIAIDDNNDNLNLKLALFK